MRLAIILSTLILILEIEGCLTIHQKHQNTYHFSLKLVHYQQLKLTFSLSKKQLAAVHILDVFWKKNSMLSFFTLNKNWRRGVCELVTAQASENSISVQKS